MKSKIWSLLLSIALATGLWMYVITTVSPNSKTTVQDIPVGESDVILPDIELVRGDVNGDDMVNARDINGFRREFGKSGTEIGNLSADINGDGRVNARDINVLRQSYGKSAQKDCTVKFNG